MDKRRKRKNFRTYDEIVVDTLREIEPATQRQLAKALNTSYVGLWSMLRKMCDKELIYVDITHRPYKYAVKELSVSYDKN